MKRFVALMFLLLAAGWPGARAQPAADAEYLNLYGSIQQADLLADSGNLKLALDKYSAAQTQLQQFQKEFPDWNPEIIKFRLRYLAGKISAATPAPPPPAPANVPANASTNAVPVPTDAAAESEVSDLRGQIQSLQSENSTLLAKLKEALGARPPAADAAELARTREQLRSMMKENDLLKAGAAEGHAGTNAPADLQAENARLLGQLAALKSSLSNAAAAGDGDLNEARGQIAALQTELKARRLEAAAIEGRYRQLLANSPATNQLDQTARIRELTEERDVLLANLELANKKLSAAGPPAPATTGVDQLNDQIRTLRDRLAVAEAQPSPYTPQELALLKSPAAPPAAAAPGRNTGQKLPAESAPLVAEAQRYFNAGQFDRAEADYLKILEKDPRNALVLGNLAAIELQQGKLEDAQNHIQAALAVDPNDAFNLATFGYLRFRQQRFDDALDALSRAARLDPQNPEIQNYLGVTLSHKGLRTPAEAALRKAIELNPDYAAAHNNLAAIYISATPPLVELARWHYQKALQAGQPHNPELEKALSDKGAPAAP